MSAPVFFSIVVPTYNRAHLLPQTIRSVMAQTFQDFELLIIDDGSKDNTAEVVQKLAETDGRIHYHYQPNAERGAARNNGIRQAKGQFIIFFDSDDEMVETYLNSLHEGIGRHSQYNFYAAKYNFVANGRETASSISPLPEGEYGLPLVLRGNPFSCNFCIRNFNEHLIPFGENKRLPLAEDWMFLVENLKTDKIYLLDKVGVRMHEHDGRSMQMNALLIECRIEATKEILGRHSFSATDTKLLWGYTYYFCSIHAYLDNNRLLSLQYIRKAAQAIGMNTVFAKAAIKYLIGRKVIQRLK